ncbi:hypothetical protein CVT26_001247 [Gymnopilus dilepis]|uniref:Protein kinase domain-containing protein n=1 Tax=Gymnopilus dilepis TaxID=231916 RepID=A0A409Y228_9AGAR|nr:hypothetical protein CVT26_001247 [Gymnopilus dilepis]
MELVPRSNVPTTPRYVASAVSSIRRRCDERLTTLFTRFTLYHVLGKRFCVVDELRYGHAFQILRVLDVVTETIKIVKVISRSLVDDEVIRDNIEWLRRRRTTEARHAELSEDFKTPFNWYLVFERPGTSLKEVLSRNDMQPLPRRHVRAIAHQIIKAVCWMMHLDICPETIELVSAATVMEWQYRMDGHFAEKVVLQCSRIRLVFYGSAGVRTERTIGTDQYRAPELIFGEFGRRFKGWASKFRTDAFSIGCVFSEMLIGRPLFPPCDGEAFYVVAKAHLFQSTLGDFPADVIHRVSLMHEGVFDSSNNLRGLYSLSSGLRHYLEDAKNIQELVEDDDELDVLKALTMISSTDRSHLSHVLCFSYFTRTE